MMMTDDDHDMIVMIITILTKYKYRIKMTVNDVGHG